MKQKNEFIACCILIQGRGIFLNKRPKGKKFYGFWEFPGGKIKKHETSKTALVRELHEELGIVTDENDFLHLETIRHSDKTSRLVIKFFSCCKWKGKPFSREKQRIKWLHYKKIKTHKMLPANKKIERKFFLLFAKMFVAHSL